MIHKAFNFTIRRRIEFHCYDRLLSLQLSAQGIVSLLWNTLCFLCRLLYLLYDFMLLQSFPGLLNVYRCCSTAASQQPCTLCQISRISFAKYVELSLK